MIDMINALIHGISRFLTVILVLTQTFFWNFQGPFLFVLLGMDQCSFRLYEESLEAGRSILGEHHPEFATIFHRLGNFHYNYDAAYDVYSQGLVIKRRVVDDANSNGIVSLCAVMQSSWRDSSSAQRMGRRNQNIFKHVLLVIQRKRAGKAKRSKIIDSSHYWFDV